MRIVLKASLVGLVGTLSLAHADDELIEAREIIPPQCYAEPNEQGIPSTYSRESMVDQPILIDRIEPDFPEKPTGGRAFYCAAFMFSVNEAGKAHQIELLYNSHPNIGGVDFAIPARAALEQWQFEPGLVDKGPAEFVGFSTVFFRAFGEAEEEYARLKASGASINAVDGVHEDWENYGRSVTQEELEQLEFASTRKMAPEAVAQEFEEKRQAEGPKPKFATSWVVADDGTVMTDYGIYDPEPVPVAAPDRGENFNDKISNDISGPSVESGAEAGIEKEQSDEMSEQSDQQDD